MGLRDNMIARILAALPGFDAAKIGDEQLQAKYDEVLAAAAPAAMVTGFADTNAAPYAVIDADEALRHFRGRGIKVQTATPVKVKGDDGVERDSMEVANEALGAAHVLSAKKWNNGEITITAIDGKRHVAGRKAA